MDQNKPELLLEAFRTKAGSEHSQCPSPLLPLPWEAVGKTQKSEILFIFNYLQWCFPSTSACPRRGTQWVCLPIIFSFTRTFRRRSTQCHVGYCHRHGLRSEKRQDLRRGVRSFIRPNDTLRKKKRDSVPRNLPAFFSWLCLTV